VSNQAKILVFQQIMLERLENTCKKKTKKELTENTHAKENKQEKKEACPFLS
jgi:hypothetical protein